MKLDAFSPAVQERIRKQMNEDDKAFLKSNETCNLPQSPVAQRAIRHESLAEEKGKGGDTKRFRVRITSYRRRLIDTDNLVGKFFLDSCRYCGWIPDDTENDIDYAIRQVKVAKVEEERTEIEIT